MSERPMRRTYTPLPHSEEEIGTLKAYACEAVQRVCDGVCESESRAMIQPEGELWITVEWKPTPSPTGAIAVNDQEPESLSWLHTPALVIIAFAVFYLLGFEG